MAHVGHVVLGQARRDAQPNLRVHLALDGLAAQLVHRLLQHLHVGLVAHGREVPRLLGAEQVARAADLEVEVRETEARAELRQVLDRLEPPFGVGRECLQAGDQQVGVGALVRTTDPPAQLIELCESQLVGPVDQDRVCARHVEAALDDRRAEQHVRVAAVEAEHHVLELALAHLAVGDQKPRLGHGALEHLLDRADRAHPVVHEEDLTAPAQFAEDRLADERLGRPADLGAHGHAIRRRRLHHRQIAHAGKG